MAKLITIWVEENANDEGEVITTYRHIAETLGGKHWRHRISAMAAWRATQEAVEAGLLATESLQGSLQQSLQASIQPPTKITRLNYRKYQVIEVVPDTAVVTAMNSATGRSRRVTTSSTKKTPDPAFSTLLGAMRQDFFDIRGEAPDFRVTQFGDLHHIRKTLNDDDEVRRRWKAFLLVPKFWPTKNLNRFRAAFQNDLITKRTQSQPNGSYPELPEIPGLEGK